jgi:hypothetical protein
MSLPYPYLISSWTQKPLVAKATPTLDRMRRPVIYVCSGRVSVLPACSRVGAAIDYTPAACQLV